MDYPELTKLIEGQLRGFIKIKSQKFFKKGACKVVLPFLSYLYQREGTIMRTP